MNVASLNLADANFTTLLEKTAPAPGPSAGAPSPAERAKVASTFGALLMRQMIDPVIEPMLQGLQGSAGGGSGMYSHLIKEALVSSLGQTGAGGLSAQFERHFTPPTSTALAPAHPPS